MATPMTELQFQALTALGFVLEEVWLDQVKVEDDLMNLFNVQDSNDAVERTYGYGGYGRIPVKTEGKPVEVQSKELLYRTDYTPSVYASGYFVTRELFDDEKYGVFKDDVTDMGIAFDREAVYQVASVFGNAFSSSTKGADGVALCSASHPNSPTDAATQSNSGSSTFGYDAVVSTRQAMRRFKDSKGNPSMIMGDTLVVPPELYETALIVVGQGDGMGGRPGTANNDKNPIAGQFKVVTSNFLTDTNDWFMIDSRYAKRWLKFWWRVKPEFGRNDAKSDPFVGWEFDGYMRFSFGWDTWRWIYGHHV